MILDIYIAERDNEKGREGLREEEKDRERGGGERGRDEGKKRKGGKKRERKRSRFILRKCSSVVEHAPTNQEITVQFPIRARAGFRI